MREGNDENVLLISTYEKNSRKNKAFKVYGNYIIKIEEYIVYKDEFF